MPHILIVEDETIIRSALRRLLERNQYQVSEAGSVQEAQERFSIASFDLIVSDLRLPGAPGTELIKLGEGKPVLIMTSYASLRSAVDSMKMGAVDYIAKPFDHDEMLQAVARILRDRQSAFASATTAAEPSRTSKGGAAEKPMNAPANGEIGIIGACAPMQDLFSKIRKVAPTDSNVLIQGESGTGKELVARALHNLSRRAKAPMISVNCAAIPETLIESELFGHEKGAFTGASAGRAGLVEAADGGTLFLDEIGDMPADTQTRLLRVLADGEFYRVGGHLPVKVDVRIIAATHQNLESLVQAGKFREDLFHRLNVIRIHIPRLADRREDIPALARHFLGRAARELAVEPKLLKPETEEFMRNLPWPGNVRQMENTCRWITVMASSREVLISDLPPELLNLPHDAAPITNWEQALRQWADQALARGQSNLLDSAVPSFERIMIETALKHTAGRRRDAAVLLGWGRNTLTRKIKELGMKVDGSDEDDGEEH